VSASASSANSQANSFVNIGSATARPATAAVVIALIVTTALVAAGCGGDRSGGPSGHPEDVVGQAPDVTLAAGTARIRINAPAATAQGVVDLGARTGRLTFADLALGQAAQLVIAQAGSYAKVASQPTWTPLAGTLPQALQGGDPFADIDLVRGTVHILSDGGGEVDGASTIRYTLTVDPQQAVETTPPARQAELRQALQGRTAMFMMDVWIDSKLFIRRVEVSTDLRAITPPTRDDRMPIATDVDYLAFGVPVGVVTPPAASPSTA
jgi:hypothetical protein